MSTSIRAVYESGHLRLLDPVDLTEGEQVNLTILKGDAADFASSGRLTAIDLMKLPLAERDRILAEKVSLAESIYWNDPELTDFEALDDHDFFDETP